MKGWLAWTAAGAAAAVFASGCGGGQDPPPTACSDGARTVLGALQRAPGDVSLEGGTLISTCVRRSLDTGQIQTLGFTYLAAANSELQLMPHSDAAALQLGVPGRGGAARGEQDQRGAARALAPARPGRGRGRAAGAAPRRLPSGHGRRRGPRMKLRLYHHHDGARVAYREAGTGPPLALLHSPGLSHREFAPVADELAERYRVVLPDLPGHGDSEDRPRHPWTPEWLAEVIAGFCGEVLGPRPLVGGHDVGRRAAAARSRRGLAAPRARSC